MFTGIPQKNRAVAKVYFDEHLSHNDYYTQGEVEIGRWIGEGAQRLGLTEGQAVEREAFMDLCDNLNPLTRTRLTLRLNSDGNRRIFFDFTCSAPKSVSVMAVTMGDARVVEAHQLAARFALKELERFAAARIRIGGSQQDRETGNVVAGEFLHNSSRALDPQMHTHFTVFNATFDPAEQRWKALQTGPMFAATHYATEVYRNDLAARLHALGYETVRTSGRSGDSFEIKGVSPGVCQRFSKRAEERDAMVAQMERELGRKLSNNEISHAVHQTRSRKLKGITTAEVRRRQLAELSRPEIAALQAVRRAADGSPRPFAQRAGEEESLDHATRHVFERRSVVSREDLLEAALVHGRGQVDLQQLKDGLETRPEFIRVGREISTREILEGELALIRTVNEGKDSLFPINRTFIPSHRLGEDQRTAVEFVLQSRDRFTGVRGLAGAGKSTALPEIARGIEEAGYKGVLCCAPTASAAEVLRKEGFDATTLQRLLVDPKLQDTLDARSVVVLDEAGAVGIEEMRQLFSLALGRNARVVLCGDTGQHGSVSRGDALRILEDHSRLSSGRLSTIRRQQKADYLEAVTLAANKQPAEAFDRLDAAGEVIEQTTGLYESAAAAYLDAAKGGMGGKGGGTALIVSPTWAEIDAVTDRVREALKCQGVIGKQEVTCDVLDSLSWTDAQKRSLQQYQPGQVVVFHQRSGPFARNEAATVLGVQGDWLRLRRADGETVSYRPASEKTTHKTAFDVCQRRPLQVAPGDKLLLQANRREARLINGQIVEVKNVEEATGAITIADGRILPRDYRTFCHGYAVTSHASQSKTVDEAIVVASSRSLGAVNREQFYVSISRGRQRCRIFTDDKLLLRDRIVRSSSRKAALELHGLEAALVREGFAPKLTARKKALTLSASLSAAYRALDNLRPIRATRALRPTRTSRLNRILQAVIAWTAHLKFIRRVSQRMSHTPTQAIHAALRPSIRQDPATQRKSRGISI
jgi:conjugative relaxase-like TrwC/TraI family protein